METRTVCPECGSLRTFGIDIAYGSDTPEMVGGCTDCGYGRDEMMPLVVKPVRKEKTDNGWRMVVVGEPMTTEYRIMVSGNSHQVVRATENEDGYRIIYPDRDGGMYSGRAVTLEAISRQLLEEMVEAARMALDKPNLCVQPSKIIEEAEAE